TSCGFAFWSHDIGGFEGNPPPAVYKRWIQFGLMSSHSRLHGSSSYRVPWLIDEESCDVLRAFTRLKARLMPYLYAKAHEATETGVPLMRAMLLEHPQDPACAPLDRQYQLGESLLVAPVFTESGEVDFYLPEGTWTHLLSGEKKQGGRWHRETHGFLSMPLYAAPGSVIAWGAETEKPDYDYASGTVLRVFELADGASAAFTVVGLDGNVAARGTVSRSGGQYAAKVTEGALRDWGLDVDGQRSPVLAEGKTLNWERS
ncbi:TIM-barrel domain-containing protein, partial [Roseateles sp. P5_E8]